MEQILNYFSQHEEMIFIVVLAIFLGLEVITNVPSVLHTPLMSGANAISGIIIIGAIILLGQADLSRFSPELAIGILAVFFATLNVAGGFVVTDRMLEMFKKKKNKEPKKIDL
jgi:H+-translocating NAD(P) transhydrogenase subunit alpha